MGSGLRPKRLREPLRGSGRNARYLLVLRTLDSRDAKNPAVPGDPRDVDIHVIPGDFRGFRNVNVHCDPGVTSEKRDQMVNPS